MLELITGLLFAALMVPVVMGAMIALIYGFGELFNVISRLGHSGQHHL